MLKPPVPLVEQHSIVPPTYTITISKQPSYLK